MPTAAGQRRHGRNSSRDGVPNVDHETKRQYRLVDQLLSMHADVRDIFERRAFALNTALIGTSLVLSVLAFVGEEVLALLGGDARLTRLQLGSVALVLLLLSIAEYRVDWKGAASRHNEAAKRLGQLKAFYRRSCWSSEAEELTREYETTMELIPAIPERWFTRLKARHLFKRALSEQLSANPRTFEWLLRVRLRFQGLRPD